MGKRKRREAAQARTGNIPVQESPNPKPAFRIAIRHEGPFVRAYLADMDSLQNAHLIGSIRFVALERDRELFEEFTALMSKATAVLSKELIGAEIAAFKVQKAPESERGINVRNDPAGSDGSYH